MDVTLEDGTVIVSHQHEEECFLVGRAETARGAEMAVATMKVGEVARIYAGMCERAT